MLDWWNSLGLASQIFYCLAIPSTLLMLIQTITMFIGFGAEGADDIGDDVDLDIDSSDSVFDEDPIYHYDTLTILGVEGEIVHLQIEASFGEGGERIFVPVDLIEEASGWRLVSPTYVTNPKK